MSRLTLSETDAQVLLMLREAKVFSDVEDRLISREPPGSICLTCADGHHFADVFARHSGLYTNEDEEACIHTFGLNGGALLLAPNSPLLPPVFPEGVHVFLLQQISDAMMMKGIRMVVLYTHFPCGAATEHQLGIFRQLELLISAKNCLKQRFPYCKVPLFVHVHWPDMPAASLVPRAVRPSVRRTYHMSRDRAVDWLRKNQALVAAYDQALHPDSQPEIAQVVTG